MPVHFEFDAVNKVILARFEGRLTEHDVEEFYAHGPGYDAALKPRSGIGDFSKVTHFDVTTEQLRRRAMGSPALRDLSLPRVIVAPSPVVYGLARMYQILSEARLPRIAVVRTMEEAYAELQLQDPRFEALGPLAPE